MIKKAVNAVQIDGVSMETEGCLENQIPEKNDVRIDDVSMETESCIENQTSEKNAKYEIEDVYKIIGFGRVQWIVLIVGLLYLLMMMNETLGMGIITIASQCDFQTNSMDQSIMSSACFLGIVSTSYLCGYLSDNIGRRSVLLYTTLTGNLLSLISIFLPTYWSFVIFRFLVGVFISGAATSVYAYIGEFFSAYYRPIAINYACLSIGISMIYIPVAGWSILTMDWTLAISDNFIFRPWRLIILSFLLPGLIASIMLIYLPESPRFYLSVNRPDDAYAALDFVCRHSKGQTLADLKIYELITESNANNENSLTTARRSNILVKMWQETRPLFERSRIGKLLISVIVMMGLYMTCSGMAIWYPTIQNRVGLSGNNQNDRTVCEILEFYDSKQKKNSTEEFCDDTITPKSYIDSITIGAAYVLGYCILGIIINPVGPKRLLVGALGLSSIFGILLIWITQPVFILVSFGIFLILPGLAISVLSGAVVEMMPTYLRAKAVCLVLMMGRLGSVIGNNISGALLETHCVLNFSLFGAFGLFCAALVFLLRR